MIRESRREHGSGEITGGEGGDVGAWTALPFGSLSQRRNLWGAQH